MSGSRTSREIRGGLLLCASALLGPHTLPALDPNQAIGQYIATRWDSRSSFPGGTINAIAQTPDGYLWIAAENGLVRFDGIAFRLLEHANTPSLPPGQVLGLVVDSEGVLWVRMESPLLFRYRGGTFEQMYRVESPERGATAITSGARGGVLIAPPDGPLRYSAGKFTPIVSSGAAAVGLAMSIAETVDGAVWVAMRDTGLFCVRGGRGSPVTGLPDQKVNVLLPGTGLDLWIGTDAGLVRWDGRAITHRGIPAALARSPILALARDHNSNLWVSTPAGIARIDSKGSIIHAAAAELPGTVHAIFEDREGDLWLGGTEGLTQLRKSPFLSYAGAADEGASVYVDTSGRAWVGPSSGGLLWIRGAERRFITGLGLEQDVIYSISGGPDEFWVGRRYGGVMQLREEDGHLRTRTYTAADGLAPGVVYAVHRSRDGTVWAGTLSGAVSRIQKDRVTTFTAADGLSAVAVTTIEETTDGVIWVGTAGGLEALRNGSWRRYSGVDGLPPGRVNSLTVDGDGVLWIGTSAGLFYWSGTRIENARNAPDSLQGEIYGVAADDAGNLWVATDRRLVRIARATLLGQSNPPAAVREFGTADGLPSARGIRRDHSVAKDPSGRIWFSFQGGLCVVNPSRPEAQAPALVHVESIAVDGRPLGPGANVRYLSNHQRVAFNFIGLSLAVPGRVRYRYLLEGYDRDWSQPTESREAAYTNLSPARYTFRVMASNSEGLWNGVPVSVPIEVEPQLWQTWWFRLIALCLTGAAIFAGFRYRIARVHAAINLRFEERLAERTRIARELHDTLLQSFQGVLMKFHVGTAMIRDRPAEAQQLLDKALDQAHQAVTEGRDAVQGLRSSTIVANDLARAITTLGEQLAAEPHCESHPDFCVTVEGQSRDFAPLVRDEVYQIAGEALRNAFRHAHAKRIDVEIRYDPRRFQLCVLDDGKGIDPVVLSAGGLAGHHGLPGMNERAKLVGGNLVLRSRVDSGTEIELVIPASIAYPKSIPARWWMFSRKAVASGRPDAERGTHRDERRGAGRQ